MSVKEYPEGCSFQGAGVCVTAAISLQDSAVESVHNGVRMRLCTVANVSTIARHKPKSAAAKPVALLWWQALLLFV
jgi:hypothetical protein